MHEGKENMRLKGIGAVAGGIAVVIALSLATDAVLHAIGVFPPWGDPVGSLPLLLATFYRTLFGIAGSYIVARLAPNRPMAHAMVSGAVGLVLSTAGAIATWNAGPAYGPKWYPLALIATALPCAWLGGRLRERQTA